MGYVTEYAPNGEKQTAWYPDTNYSTPRDMYNAEITKIAENPGIYNPNERASFLGMTFGNHISPQEYIASLESIYGPGTGWAEYNPQVKGVSTATSGGTDETALSRQYYDDQIKSVNQLLGHLDPQEQSGLSNIQKKREALNLQKSDAMFGYDQQGTENLQDKEKNYNTVDTYARDSVNSLNRILQGANAGNSAVGQTLLPYLVSKSAGTRRANATEMFGKNQRDLDQARTEATNSFGTAEDEINTSEGSFRSNLANKRAELLGQRQQYEIARDNGYSKDAMASQGDINAKMDQLNQLFGQFQPTYKAVSTRKPDLGQYTVDRAQLSGGANIPGESRGYLSQLLQKKRLEEQV